MKKKTIVYGLLIFNIIIMTFILSFSFSIQSEESLTKGKKNLLYMKPDSITNKIVASQIYETANKYNIDLMLEYYNEKGSRDYYYIYKSPDSWQMSLQGGKLKEGTIYSTRPDDDENRIYGIFYESYAERLVPFEKIDEIKDINFSTVSIWIPSKYEPIYRQMLNKMGYEESNKRGGAVYDDSMDLKMLLFSMTLFFLLSVIIYAFSRNSEYAILKSEGYSPLDILKMEYKGALVPSLIILFAESILITAVMTFKYNLGTVGTFLIKYGKYYILFYLTYFVIFSFAVIYVYGKVGISDIKGRSLKRILIIISVAFKLLILALICNQLSQIMVQVKELTKDMEMYSISKKRCDGIAQLHAMTETRDIDSNEKYIAERFLDFLDETDKAFILDLPENMEEEDVINSGTISIGYLNVNEIYLPDGRRLTPDMIDKTKNNYLVPEGYDYTEAKEQLKKYLNIDANFIYYDKDCKFYAYYPSIARNTNGVEQTLFLEIINTDWYRKDIVQNDYEASYLVQFMDNVYFTYDVNSELSAYEQIYDSLNKNDLTLNMPEAISVSHVFYEALYGNIQYSIKLLIYSIIYIISYVILLFYAVTLLVDNHLREIMVKIREGYSFINIFWLYIFLLAYQIPVLILVSIRDYINIGIGLSAVAVDIILLILIAKHIVKRKNLAKLEAVK